MDKLVSPRKTAEVIKKYNIKLTKKYGQNFLVDENILLKILSFCDLSQNDSVLEVGPGIGTLTQYLCPRVKKVTAVEIDRRLIEVLEDTLKQCHNLEVVQGDIMKEDLANILSSLAVDKKCKIISNLPYNITTPLIMNLLKHREFIQHMIFMVQKEAAHRITAQPGGKEYGAVSVLVHYYAHSEIAFNISPRVFIPQPEVESSLIKITMREKPLQEVRNEEFFTKVVRGSFQHRRKSLLNSLKMSLNIDKGSLDAAIREAGIEPSSRAESLSPGQFANLANILYNSIGEYTRTKI
ncbi:16S rRNA (adenine(1518)-N(6)/adenine(1519)-N(6))-dimethyltransferase RsmA [Candidatus Contubernalis alkaliaceticus]|uniref:16S rRNA (adenine(1518)-N(6)/adenine(1519)-N(6))- dimethyltransferase RsmA n=1 Tax=Candidatus Contubernalis alkaliaceticus TaxID=338645 RepID=UPI001F4BF7CB|nr:16S rRNA (adenine(1518)-N(6)/adenine(1519)-N(6))-dimethyltransferase RsmA [Candidatus Contubernalis alkalaceticus]UNC90683.1 16S rRNA (adenine(1518)-N(6)/adenine(1519)-N(6))-dimethyltransferase RsmA [Candidatus Contubernalis alkalaceticus]